MDEQIEIFNHPKFGAIRALIRDDGPWFVAIDVCNALGYKNTRDALYKHVDSVDKNTVAIRDGIQRGNPNMTVINESGLYSLIMSSKLPSAQEFKHWVTSEVLPTIRKTGYYNMNGQSNETFNAINELNIDGDDRTKLKNKIKFYAGANNIHISDAYNHFDQYFNNKYGVDIKARKRNYTKKHGLKKMIGTPEFLEITGKLKEGFAVADEMIMYKCHQFGAGQNNNAQQIIGGYIQNESILRNYAVQNFYAGLNSCVSAIINKKNYARAINCPCVLVDDLPKVYLQFIRITNDPVNPVVIDYNAANKYVMNNYNLY